MKTNAQLQQDVSDELFWDPAVGISDLMVTADDGNITLSGISATYDGKYEAELAAYRVLGVRSVTNNISVDPAALGVRPDSDIAQDVRSALILDVAVPDSRIGVSVMNGIVTLNGDVDWFYQRSDAEEDARMIRGVLGVDDQIAVLQPDVMATDISDSITAAFARNAELYDDNILVTVGDGGKVTLSGSVETWGERNMAEDIAWRARGVTDVNDNISVEYP